jgi:hypothetical protein
MPGLQGTTGPQREAGKRYIYCFIIFFFVILVFELRAYNLEPLHQPFFSGGFF